MAPLVLFQVLHTPGAKTGFTGKNSNEKAEEAGAAVRPRCRSSAHGGEGRKKA